MTELEYDRIDRALSRIEDKLDKGIDKLDSRVAKIESWQSWLKGAWAVIAAACVYIWQGRK